MEAASCIPPAPRVLEGRLLKGSARSRCPSWGDCSLLPLQFLAVGLAMPPARTQPRSTPPAQPHRVTSLSPNRPDRGRRSRGHPSGRVTAGKGQRLRMDGLKSAPGHVPPALRG